ncbi:MAG: Ig-like domain-containing protein, partial [Candidatus Heimdallarchaeota archaeon]|nr:Ig-like domain-containing protein [Candidatus Heimdallarchaeota archaeon]
TTDLVTTSDALFPTYPGTNSMFITIIGNEGTTIDYSTFYGGSSTDVVNNIAIDNSGGIYITGQTYSLDFPTTQNAYNSTNAGGADVYALKLIYDNYGPNIDLSVNSNQRMSSNDIINLDITDPSTVHTVLFNWDNNVNQTIFEPYTISLPALEGNYTLNVYANDTNGLWSTKSIFVLIDNTPPLVSIPYTNGTTIQGGIDFNLTIIHDTINDVNFVIASWDTNPYNILSYPYTLTSPENDGLHRLYIFVNDTAGNYIELMYELTVDAVAPQISLVSHTDGANIGINEDIEISIIDVNNFNAWYYWEGQTVNSSITSNNIIIGPSDPGTYNLHVFAEDEFGNLSSESFTFTVIQPNNESSDPSLAPTSNTDSASFISYSSFMILLSSLVFIIILNKKLKRSIF